MPTLISHHLFGELYPWWPPHCLNFYTSNSLQYIYTTHCCQTWHLHCLQPLPHYNVQNSCLNAYTRVVTAVLLYIPFLVSILKLFSFHKCLNRKLKFTPHSVGHFGFLGSIITFLFSTFTLISFFYIPSYIHPPTFAFVFRIPQKNCHY